MLISDLTYLEVVTEEANIEGGLLPCFPCLPIPRPCLPMPTGGVTIGGNIPATGSVQYLGLSILSNPCVTGNTAKVEGFASATGSNTFTSFTPQAVVAPGSSYSGATAIAVSM